MTKYARGILDIVNASRSHLTAEQIAEDILAQL